MATMHDPMSTYAQRQGRWASPYTKGAHYYWGRAQPRPRFAAPLGEPRCPYPEHSAEFNEWWEGYDAASQGYQP